MIKDANVTIMVKDLDSSISFYQSIGFTVATRWGHHYAQLAAAGITLGLHPAPESSSNGSAVRAKGSGNVSLGFTTDDFDEVQSLLEQIGIPYTTRKEEGGEFLHFVDPDCTDLYFIKPKL